jgi:hypothetical protein
VERGCTNKLCVGKGGGEGRKVKGAWTYDVTLTVSETIDRPDLPALQDVCVRQGSRKEYEDIRDSW